MKFEEEDEFRKLERLFDIGSGSKGVEKLYPCIQWLQINLKDLITQIQGV